MTPTHASKLVRAPAAPGKIFCIGFNKTGVKTLEHVLREQLGLRVTVDPMWTYWTWMSARDRLEAFDAFVDGECANVRQLDAAFVGSRFILNTRRLDRWLVSRHLAVERSRRLTRWIASRVVDGTPAFIEAHFLDNSDAAMTRWVQIRNSYHAHVLAHFDGRPDALLVIDLESEREAAFRKLESFLGLNRALEHAHRNRRGDGTPAGRLYAALFQDQDAAAENSEACVQRFLEHSGLSRHAHVDHVIDDPKWFMPDNFVDRVLDRVPSLAPWQEKLLGHACRARGHANGVVTSYLADRLIALCRSQSKTDRFVPIDRFASASR